MLKTAPLVSVIIPCYNHGKELIEALNSIKKQTYKKLETIVVNDGSIDSETIEILKSIKDQNKEITILYQENQGPSCAKNTGILQANGDFILPLDCDNKLNPDFIEKALNFLFDNNSDIVYTNYKFYGTKNDIYYSLDFNLVNLLKTNYIENCSLFKKEVWIKTGGYDTFLSKKGLEDWEFWINAAKSNFKFTHLNEVLFDYLVTENSRTNLVANKNLDEIKSYVYKKHSDILAKEFEFLYHENKNLKSLIDYRLGNIILSPIRLVKRLFFNKISIR